MSTLLSAARIELSKQIADGWSSTTTSAGAAGGTTLVDTALKAKQNDWLNALDAAYDFITSGTYANEERYISTLDNSTGTATMLAHGGQIASAVTYEIHRLWSPSDKRLALIHACRKGFPHIHTKIKSETLRAGNWLKNGDFYKWTSSSTPDDWTVATVTAAANTTVPYYLFGSKSMKLSTASGTVKQGTANNPIFFQLANKTAKFRLRGWCNTTSCLRIAIYDGTTRTYSDYHSGNSAWDYPDNETLYVEQDIAKTPTEVTLEIYHASASGISYVTDARVLSNPQDKIYIGYLGLARDTPNSVSQMPEGAIQSENWQRLHNWSVDADKYLHLPTGIDNYFLKIEGMGYLDFLASGVSSTAWTATVDIDSPQLDILVAEAAVYLYTQMMMPNQSKGDRSQFGEGLSYWQNELADRRVKYGMPLPQVSKIWRV